MPNSKQIVYLSQAQYAELIANGTITVNGVTVTYDENDIYVTPQAEPVTDVRVAGTSVAANGVADVPVASTNNFGVIRVNTLKGTTIDNLGDLVIHGANENYIKAARSYGEVINPLNQHLATFYGLAKIAGDTTQPNSTNPSGTYTPEAKGAIQQMLGVSDLIATAENSLVASKAYAIGDVFTANGKLYKATAAIAADGAIIPAVEGEEIAGANCVETSVGEGFVKFTDYPVYGQGGVVRIDGNLGIELHYGKTLKVHAATDVLIKAGYDIFNPIVSNNQHKSVFYGLAKAAGADEKDSTLPVGQYTDTAKAAIKSMIGVNVDDVQVNGTSIMSDGIANIPIAGNNTLGTVRTGALGVEVRSNDGVIYVNQATETDLKAGNNNYRPVCPTRQHNAVFYGLAKASGDTTQSASSNAVGVYTDNAKASIKAMLGIQDGSTGTVDVSGTTPTITAVENTRYVCGEVTSLNFTPATSGICIVRFTSGSSITVLTLPSTVKFPEWFDPTSLETNTIYEICVTDGVYGAVMSWAL